MKTYQRWLTYVAIAISVGLISGLVSFYVISKATKVEVPDLSGRSRTDAERMLDSLGLNLIVNEEVHDVYIPKNHIIEQDITPGTYVDNDTKVKVVVSQGPEVRLIPSFLGKKLDDAKALLAEKGLELNQIIMVHSDKVPKDVVIAQRPEPAEWTGETITLIASDGPRDVIYYCPEFTGMKKDDAMFLAHELDLVAVTVNTGDSSVITEQDPKPGTEIKAGWVVTLKLGGS